MSIIVHCSSSFILQCYIEITSKSLEAVISGGSERVIHYDRDIILDASPSLERNKLGSKSSQLNFTWTCDYISARFCKPVTYTDGMWK